MTLPGELLRLPLAELVGEAEAARLAGLPVDALRRLVDAGEFPSPRRPRGARGSRFALREVEAWAVRRRAPSSLP
ncbi:MAG: hypothetical protein RL722_527 [Pseudomonadota bacterium]